MTYRFASLLAATSLLATACIVYTDPEPAYPPPPPQDQPGDPHGRPGPGHGHGGHGRPDPRPEPEDQLTCARSGGMVYRETHTPIHGSAHATETITIYRSGAYLIDASGTGADRAGCLDHAEMRQLRNHLTAARLETQPQITCKALPHTQVTAELFGVGTVTWRQPCSQTPDAESMRGIQCARDLTGDRDGASVCTPSR